MQKQGSVTGLIQLSRQMLTIRREDQLNYSRSETFLEICGERTLLVLQVQRRSAMMKEKMGHVTGRGE